MDTFTPLNPPDYSGNGANRTPREISVQFGDGYALSAPDGLNPNDATASYQWSNVSQAELVALLDFYESHIGQTFKWAAPCDYGKVGKWKITGFKDVVASYNTYTVSISFKRSFELG